MRLRNLRFAVYQMLRRSIRIDQIATGIMGFCMGSLRTAGYPRKAIRLQGRSKASPRLSPRNRPLEAHPLPLWIEAGTYKPQLSVDIYCLDVAPFLRWLTLPRFRPHVIDPS